MNWSVEAANDVAEMLITLATREASELIAMISPGRSGLERWLVGSVTERIIDGAKLPLLGVRPQPLAARTEWKKEKNDGVA